MTTSTKAVDDGEKPLQPSSPGFLDAKREESDLEQGSTRAPSREALDSDDEKRGFSNTKREESDLEQGSTRAPSTAGRVDDEKKEANDEKKVNEKEEAVSDSEEPTVEDPNPDEYPSGARLLFIVVALVLSIFLVALDMVSLPSAVIPCAWFEFGC